MFPPPTVLFVCLFIRLATPGLSCGMRVVFIIVNFIYLFLAVLGVRCCSLFFGCGTWASLRWLLLSGGPALERGAAPGARARYLWPRA